MGFPTSLAGRHPSSKTADKPVVPHQGNEILPARAPSDTRDAWRLQAGLEAARAQHQKSHDEAARQWQEAETYLTHKDDVTVALEDLSSRAQARSKRLFEGLLTTLIHEVMPNAGDQVRLTTGLRNHKRTLEVDVEIDGELENVFRDKGGSVKNLISMGLRFIVLSRSTNRRFLVFDESDCWLKPNHIPKVAQLVFELAHRIGVQVIYISHHDTACFAGRAKIVNLTLQDGSILTDIGDEPPAPALEGLMAEDENAALVSGLGLKYLRLVNFKRHESTYIPLSPHVTVIAGDNDIGKSAVVQALECVVGNAGRTGVIRRGTSACEVEIGLEDNLSLSWRYNRTGTRKTSYTLLGADGTVQNEYDRATEVPPWLHDYLDMAPVGDFDLHLQCQDESNFLIDDRLPSTRRAELLSLGREAYYVQRMTAKHSDKVRQFKRDANQAKKTIATHLNALAALESLAAETQTLKDLDEQRTALESSEQERIALAQYVQRSSQCRDRCLVLAGLDSISRPQAPELVDTESLGRLAEKLSTGRHRQSALASLDGLVVPKPPTLVSTEDLVRLGMQIAGVRKRLTVLQEIPIAPEKPVLVPADDLGQMLEHLQVKQQAIKDRCEQLKALKARHTDLQREREQLIEALGGSCPTCEKPLKEHGDHDHA